MKILASAAAALTLAIGLASAPAGAAEFNDKQKSEIGEIVRDYLVKNPEVLREAMIEFERKQKAEETAQRDRALESLAPKIFESKYQAVIGNPKGKITLVEFFDYNCGYCKKALSDVARLAKEQPDLRVVLRDFPVLSQGSVEAAQVAGAAQRQLQGDRFWQFHQKLLAMRGQIGRAQALDAAREAGADMDRLEKDMKSPDIRKGLEEVREITEQLSLNGTPSWVIGREVVIGAVGFDELRDKIDNMRKCGKATCG